MSASGYLASTLIGTWRIHDYLAVRPDGDTLRLMGSQLQGYIMYAADGHVSVNLQVDGRVPYASGDFTSATVEERAAAAAGYFAYAGTYQVDEALRMVTHKVLFSLVPNWVNSEQKRLIILEGSRLELCAPETSLVKGEPRILRIIWERTDPA